MRADQLERLGILAEKVMDATLLDLDPDTWPGAGKTVSEMDRDERGDHTWVLKALAQKLQVLSAMKRLQEYRPAGDGDSPDQEANLQQQFTQATKDADAILKKVKARAK